MKPRKLKLSKDIISVIEKNCSDFLKQRSIAHLLYRGSKSTKSGFVSVSPTNRKPIDSDSFYSNTFDKMLLSCGMTAIRSNSIFTTSIKSTAEGYGNVFVIFPINGYKYTYTKYSDLVLGETDRSSFMFDFPKLIEFFSKYFKEKPQIEISDWTDLNTWIRDLRTKTGTTSNGKQDMQQLFRHTHNTD